MKVQFTKQHHVIFLSILYQNAEESLTKNEKSRTDSSCSVYHISLPL